MSGRLPLKRAAWYVWERLAARAGRSYIAGATIGDAVAVARPLANAGYGLTLAYWNVAGEPPDLVFEQTAQTLAAISKHKLPAYLSIKSPALDYDPALHARLFADAAGRQVSLHFDAHGPETVDPTLIRIQQARQCGMVVGITLPGRWPRSVSDADWAARAGVSVRVVKGLWPDSHEDVEKSRGFLQVIDRLAGSACHVHVATHDTVLAREAIRRLTLRGTACDWELLYGFPWKACLNAAQSGNIPVRFYVPFGHGWLPYCLSQLRRQPHLFNWIIRDMLSGPGHRIPLAGRAAIRTAMPL